MTYPSNASEDAFYSSSEILVEKGDYIRLQDLQFSYDFNDKYLSKMGFQTAQVYINTSNLGIIWRANKFGIDPDVITQNSGYYSYPNPRNYSFGIKLGF